MIEAQGITLDKYNPITNGVLVYDEGDLSYTNTDDLGETHDFYNIKIDQDSIKSIEYNETVPDREQQISKKTKATLSLSIFLSTISVLVFTNYLFASIFAVIFIIATVKIISNKENKTKQKVIINTSNKSYRFIYQNYEYKTNEELKDVYKSLTETI